MHRWKVPLSLMFVFLLVLVAWKMPIVNAFTFTETRTQQPTYVYELLSKAKEFQIRYEHSIFLTDVEETYRVLPNGDLKFLTMRYEDVGIGLPGYAEEGEKLSISKDGHYTLTYENKVIESFILYVGDVDAELTFIYKGNESDLKSVLKRGKSYEFRMKKLTLFEWLKGAKLNGKEK